jgi:Ca2+-binding RTX toxin-like protein
MPIKVATFTGATTATLDTTSSHTGQFNLLGDLFHHSTTGYYLEGTANADQIWGSSLDDTIHGLGGNDILYGQDGNDTIFGEDGNDQLYGGAGIDTLDGGNGNDFMMGGAGADKLLGGAGDDTVSYAGSSSVTVQLGYQGFGGDAEGDTYNGVENVVGSSFNDTLIGDAGNNTLNGGGGDDQIMGGAGRDVLIGGAGKDTLTGDTSGVYENDTFVIQKFSGFSSPPNWQAFDTITDFQQNNDKIQLSGYSAADFGSDGQLATGMLYEDGIIRFTDHLDASDKLYYDEFSSALFECNIQMQNGEAHLVSSTEVVHINMEFINSFLTTSDFLFA